MIGSLFSGIGGLELGLERAGLGPVLWQVEIDPFCRKILAKHWPNAKRFEDVEAIDPSDLPAVDLVCGGFPCQDLSVAGKGAGLGGDRSGLWFQFARIVAGTKPRHVVVENVAHGRGRSRGERGKVEPRLWVVEGARVRISVHRMHGLPDLWFVSCVALGVDRVALVSRDLEGAKVEAIAWVKAEIDALVVDFESATR